MKKNNQILIGTHNKGKYREICKLLKKNIKKISPNALKIKSPKETGKTFLANSKLKANYFYKKSNLISISDDSGLQVQSLRGRPGIYSARWAKKYGSFSNAMKFILKKMKNKKNRAATFICSLSFKYPKKKPINVIGKIQGRISLKILGKKGFGYDPIFIPNGHNKTFGEISPKLKMTIDHRYKAYDKIKKFF